MLTDCFSFMSANNTRCTSAAVATRRKRRAPPAGARGTLTALCKAWAAYTLKRAIADVTATSEEDYRAFGLDKTEMLNALEQLRDQLQRNGTPAGGVTAHNRVGASLAVVVVTRREPRALVGPERACTRE